jgi:putative peptide maturation system protein
MPATAVAVVLAEAVELLRDLLRRRTAVPAAGAAPPDGGVPVPAAHPAVAGYLVTVDRVRLRVAEALLLLVCRPPYGDRAERCLLEEIVEQCLLMNETLEDREPLDEAELRAAAEDFRAGHGLRDRASTLAWLAELPLSGEQFEAFIAGIARRRRFRRRKEAELARGYLAAHRCDFDRVRALWVTGSEPVNGEWLRGPAGLAGCGEAVMTVGERWARDLPAPLRHAAHDTLVGPTTYGAGFLTGIVLERRVARDDDAETLAAAGAAAYREWLAVRRRRASVEWHWL